MLRISRDSVIGWLLQKQIMSAEEPNQAEIEDLNRHYEMLSQNPLIHDVFEAERQFKAVFDEGSRFQSDMLRPIAK